MPTNITTNTTRRGCQAARRERAVQVLLPPAGQHSGADAGARPVAVCRDQGVTTHTSAQSASGEVTSSHVDPAVSKRAALAVLRRTACLAKAEAACKQMHRRQKGVWAMHSPARTLSDSACRRAIAECCSQGVAAALSADTHACAALLHGQAASLQPRLVHPCCSWPHLLPALVVPHTHHTKVLCVTGHTADRLL